MVLKICGATLNWNPFKALSLQLRDDLTEYNEENPE